MPIGVIVVVLAVVSGGLIGSVLGNRLPENIKTQMNSIFGLCSICMGVSAVMLMKNMPAVIFSVILGTSLGLLIHLGDNLTFFIHVSTADAADACFIGAEAAAKLVEDLGGQVVKMLFVMELAGLEGRKKLDGYDVRSLIVYPGK